MKRWWVISTLRNGQGLVSDFATKSAAMRFIRELARQGVFGCLFDSNEA